MADFNSYRDLKVWQAGMRLTKLVYKLTTNFPRSELYGLTSQVRRSAVSISSNIAEGHARGSTKELLRFVGIARGSLAEMETQVILANELGFVDESATQPILDLAEEESRMLSGLRKSLEAKLT